MPLYILAQLTVPVSHLLAYVTVPLKLYGIMQQICMWQSQVEVKYYSVAYFNRILAFEVL